jgi:hypothetical protein
MEAVTERKSPGIQTAFRIPEDLLVRMKQEAKKRGTSLNAFVIDVMNRETRVEWPHLPKDYKVSQEILNLKCVDKLREPTPEEFAEDPKLEYLWNKYVKTY